MPKTFTNEKLTRDGWHRCKTERGTYLMGPSWIDTACPCDMMDWDYTQSFAEGVKAANETHMMWASDRAVSR